MPFIPLSVVDPNPKAADWRNTLNAMGDLRTDLAIDIPYFEESWKFFAASVVPLIGFLKSLRVYRWEGQGGKDKGSMKHALLQKDRDQRKAQ